MQPQQPQIQAVAADTMALLVCVPVRSGSTSVKLTNLHQKIKNSWLNLDLGYSNGNVFFSKLTTLAGLSLDFYNLSMDFGC